MRTQKKLVWILILAIVMTLLPGSGAYAAERQPVYFQVQMGTSAGAPQPIEAKVEAGAGETVYATVSLVNSGSESIDLAGILLGLSYNTKDFSFVSARALLSGTTTERPKEGDIRILNVDTKEGGKIATVGGGSQSVQLVELELKVKNAVPGDVIRMALNEAGRHEYQLVGNDHQVDTPVGEFGAITVAQPLGVEVSGKVALTEKAADVSKATVVLTTNTVGNAASDVYGYITGGNDYVANVEKDGTWSIPTVASGHYTMLIRMPGALYYRKNNMEVAAGEAVVYKDIMLYLGDLNMDGRITLIDQNEVLSSKNYNKTADMAEKEYADLNSDGRITLIDQNIVLSSKNYNKAAVVE